MSDTGRQSATDKLSSNMKPDSQKGTLEQAKDVARDKLDGLQGAAQPNSNKSTTQKATDKAGSMGESVKDKGASMMDDAKKALGMGDK